MEITAKEIERQATRVDEEVNNFYSSCNSVIKRLEEMENIVKSDDSYLSKKIGEYKQSYITLQTTVKNEFTNLANTMHSYAINTLKNEEQAQEGVGEVLGTMRSVKINTDLKKFFVNWD